jgi:hypothetical protein
MAKFRDNASGNVFVFESQHDIDSLRKHPEYTEVIEEQVVRVVEEPLVLKKPLTTKKQLKEV